MRVCRKEIGRVAPRKEKRSGSVRRRAVAAVFFRSHSRFPRFFSPHATLSPHPKMSRGNKREVDRARAAARAGKPKASEKDGLTAQQRRER
jgi:hypothetical protein